MLNKQMRTVDKVWSSSLEVGRGFYPVRKQTMLRNVTQGLNQWWALVVNTVMNRRVA